MYIYTSIHTHESIHICPHVTSIHRCTHIHLYTHAYTCIHTHIHLYTHTYIHTHMHNHASIQRHTNAHHKQSRGHNLEEQKYNTTRKTDKPGSPTQWICKSLQWKGSTRLLHAAQKPYSWGMHLYGTISSDSGIPSPLLTCLRRMGSPHVKCLQMCRNQPSFKKAAIFQNEAPVCHSKFN